jgi:hypothetical protein
VSTVTVGGQLVAQGVIGPGPAPTPTLGGAVGLLPPPPAPLRPPVLPPAPLLPPPVERTARMPPVGAEVPVIPEADSLGLLALGALGVLAAALLRRRR